MKSISYTQLKKEILSDPNVKKAYDKLESEFASVRQTLKRRIKKI